MTSPNQKTGVALGVFAIEAMYDNHHRRSVLTSMHSRSKEEVDRAWADYWNASKNDNPVIANILVLAAWLMAGKVAVVITSRPVEYKEMTEGRLTEDLISAGVSEAAINNRLHVVFKAEARLNAARYHQIVVEQLITMADDTTYVPCIPLVSFVNNVGLNSRLRTTFPSLVAFTFNAPDF